jgi:hypothetical protein
MLLLIRRGKLITIPDSGAGQMPGRNTSSIINPAEDLPELTGN